jgi:hypothetical protein
MSIAEKWTRKYLTKGNFQAIILPTGGKGEL